MTRRAASAQPATPASPARRANGLRSAMTMTCGRRRSCKAQLTSGGKRVPDGPMPAMWPSMRSFAFWTAHRPCRHAQLVDALEHYNPVPAGSSNVIVRRSVLDAVGCVRSGAAQRRRLGSVDQAGASRSFPRACRAPGRLPCARRHASRGTGGSCSPKSASSRAGTASRSIGLAISAGPHGTACSTDNGWKCSVTMAARSHAGI